MPLIKDLVLSHPPPGTIAILHFKRWTIEKTFNNTKSNFKETKAWSSNNSKRQLNHTFKTNLKNG
ncbi:hypothetical protein, partial [Bathymodiolus platifrons methanotrophic gill symbiont]|uniref:hypothetical protein n=1 Tax=Bathymodiolus platifrons methanotrophic gill symbiont TaxID=113268 RepID=UPI001B7D77DB